jgi:hypothetical protein
MAKGELSLAVPELEAAVADLPKGDPLWPRVASGLARAQLSSGQVLQAVDLWHEVRELGEATEDPHAVAEVQSGLGLVDMVEGRMGEGRQVLEDAEYRLRQSGSPVDLVRVMLLLGELALADGRLLGATERALEAERLAREIPRIEDCIRAMGIAASACVARGDVDEGRRVARDAAALARARGSGDSEDGLRASMAVARALCQVDEWDDAASLLPSEAADGDSALWDLCGGTLALRAWAISRREPDRALALARQSLERALPMVPWAAARRCLDVAHATASVSPDFALESVDRVLSVLGEGRQCRLQILEACALGIRLGRGGSMASRGAQLRAGLASEQGRPEDFDSHWG